MTKKDFILIARIINDMRSELFARLWGSAMSYYEIHLPERDNSGRVLDAMHQAFRAFVLHRGTSFHVLAPVSGVWMQGGKCYYEQMIPYHIACSEVEWKLLVGKAMDLFSDQIAIFHAKIGIATIEYREKRHAAE